MTVAVATVTEKDFLGQVIDLAHILGFQTAHFRPALTGRGWRTSRPVATATATSSNTSATVPAVGPVAVARRKAGTWR